MSLIAMQDRLIDQGYPILGATVTLTGDTVADGCYTTDVVGRQQSYGNETRVGIGFEYGPNNGDGLGDGGDWFGDGLYAGMNIDTGDGYGVPAEVLSNYEHRHHLHPYDLETA